jgi:hypothetical protein
MQALVKIKTVYMSEQKGNKSNLFYFESSTMRGLYDCLESWQNTAQIHIRSLSIHQDHGNFCCIVLTDSSCMDQESLTLYEDDMERFQRKALKHIGVGVEFVSDHIKPEKIQMIQSKLTKCKTPADIRAVFLEAFSTD